MIAVIADIHANAVALEAVLEDIAARGIKRIIVNGDMVNRGPDNVRVMDMLLNHPHVEAITLGNHDDLMRKWVAKADDLPPAWFDDPFFKGMAWAASRLADAGYLDVFATLPTTLAVRERSLPRVLVAHGTPRHYREGVGKYLTEDALTEIIRAYPAALYVGSHTHIPFDHTFLGKRFVNTGAVGTPFNRDPRAQYLVLHESHLGWDVEFCLLPYRVDKALKVFDDSGYLEEGGVSARIFYEELKRSRQLYMHFWRWTEEGARPRDWESWNAFQCAQLERV